METLRTMATKRAIPMVTAGFGYGESRHESHGNGRFGVNDELVDQNVHVSASVIALYGGIVEESWSESCDGWTSSSRGCCPSRAVGVAGRGPLLRVRQLLSVVVEGCLAGKLGLVGIRGSGRNLHPFQSTLLLSRTIGGVHRRWRPVWPVA